MAKKAAPKASNRKASPPPAPKASSRAATPAAKAGPKGTTLTSKTASPATAGRPRPANRAAVVAALAERTGLGKKEITGVFAAMGELIARELGKKGPGQFAVPGLLKIKVVRKPATKARSGRNPFTGEAMTFKARPARNVVRAVPLKALKDLV